MPDPVPTDGVTGIIGGKGLYKDFRFSWSSTELKATKVEEETVHTPFGVVEAKKGHIRGWPVVVISRHGTGKKDVERPTRHRANIYALKELGCEKVYSISAATSVSKGIQFGTIVFPDQYVDMTGELMSFDGKAVDMEVPFCPDMRKLGHSIAISLGIASQGEGTYANMAGPAYETAAEADAFRKMGADIVGISVAHEAKLAREKNMCYQPICLIVRFPEGRKDIDAYIRALPMVDRLQQDVMRLLEELFGNMPSYFLCLCRK